MRRGTLIALIAIVAVIVVLLVTVNVTRCDSVSGPFGFLRFTACTEEPLVNP